MTIEASLARFDTNRPTTATRSLRPSLARRLELRARRRRRTETSRSVTALG